jgi:tetratricopeptide (TPR) repeat protein
VLNICLLIFFAEFCIGDNLVKQGRYDEALAEAQKQRAGHVYARLGRRSEADALIKELEKRYSDKSADGRDLAVVYAGLDDKDQAFAWLDKAFAEHSVFLAFLKLEPLLEPLQSDPRWKDLERRVGISN